MITPEEAIEMLTGKREVKNARCNGKNKTIDELKQIIIEALENQIPQTAAYDELIKEWHCPCCGFPVTDIHEYGFSDSYCWHCGQAIEWGD